jgi:hypothetical protein
LCWKTLRQFAGHWRFPKAMGMFCAKSRSTLQEI